jgi:4-hydroxybenzoate polyprenyltransferase
VRAYVELLRPPNVATALADVLAGYAIAGLGSHVEVRLVWLLVATACLYGGGVVLNDYFDRRIDQSERPERPIPSGRVPAANAAAFGGALLAIGVVAGWLASPAAGWVAGSIAILVLTYDAWAKKSARLGPINMGACRAFNLLLGIAAVGPMVQEHWPLALLPFFYIWAVTTVSRGEVHGGRKMAATSALVAISGVIAGLLVLSFRAVGMGRITAILLALALAWRVLPPYWRARNDGRPPIIRHAVRSGVLSLVLLDASLSAVYAGTWYALVVVAAAFVAGWLARQFAVT